MKFKILAYVPDKDIFTQRDEIFKLIMEFETFEQALNYVRSWQSYFINWGITNIETNVFMAVKYRPIPIPKCDKEVTVKHTNE